MQTKMLLCCALLLLAGCAEPKPPNIPEKAAEPPAILNSSAAQDTDQSWQAEAEARGAAQAFNDIQSDIDAEEAREKS